MSVALVSTAGHVTPYITVEQLERSPVSSQLKKLVPEMDEGERYGELDRIIRRASSMINGEVRQNLAATVDSEIGQVRVSDWGDLRLHTRSSPIVSVLSVSVGPDPANLTPISDLSNIVIEPWRITIPRGSLSLRPRSQMWAQWTYINGWPVTTLTATVSRGATSVTVADSTGILANQTLLTVQDGGSMEQFIPTAVTGNVLTVPPMAYPHQQGTGVTALPDVIEEATLLLISRLHGTWSLTMNAISMDGNGAKKPSAGPARAMCDAAVMLAPFRRVW